ncbi:MAG: hypothetical protein AAB943_00605 [Patescibacteria group bacterium]
MEQNFQTSFIPKQSMMEEPAATPRSFGILTVISVIIFLTMVVASGGLYFYKQITVKSISNMEKDLDLAKNRFEPSKIVQLQILDRRLRASTEILSKHIAISPIFKALQDITMKTVRYTGFSYDLNTDKNFQVRVKMGGLAVGYRSIALQADLFSQNKYFIDPIFSNLSLDDKGNVLFELEFSVEPSFVDYQQMIEITNGPSPVLPASGAETTN